MTPPVSGGVPEPLNLDALEREHTRAMQSFDEVGTTAAAYWAFHHGAKLIAALRAALGGVPEQGLRDALEFSDAKLRILLSSHLCIEHGSGECSDVEGAREAIRRTRAALERPRPALPPQPERFRADEVVAQFWKDEVEPETREPFTQDFAYLLEAFALWIHDTFDLVRSGEK